MQLNERYQSFYGGQQPFGQQPRRQAPLGAPSFPQSAQAAIGQRPANSNVQSQNPFYGPSPTQGHPNGPMGHGPWIDPYGDPYSALDAQMGGTSHENPDLGIMGQVKQWLIDLLFEPVDDGRPIGISQLSRKTFVAQAGDIQNGVFYKPSSVEHQDFRFSKLREG